VIDTGTELVTKDNAANYAPAGAAPAVDVSKVRILVSMKGPGGGNPFWAAVERGALEKGKELGVEVIVLARQRRATCRRRSRRWRTR
jgi:ABC-type sugar transport system substrate-binding protein